MSSKWIGVDGRMVLFSYPLYERLRDQIEGLSTAAQDSVLVTSILRRQAASADDGQTAQGRCVSANFFEVLGVPALKGRTFEPNDDRAQDASPVLVLSHRFWQRRFDSDPTVIGEKLSVDGTRFVVVGIAPPGFHGASVGTPDDFWVPMGMANTFTRSGTDIHEHAYFALQLFGRLKPQASLHSAQASADVILKRYAAEQSDAGQALEGADHLDRDRSRFRELRIELEPGATGLSTVRHAYREPLLVLMAGVGLLLLIVGLNVSHLLLARALNRKHEMTVRTALGATRARLVRQLLTEGFLLAGLAAAAAALVTDWLSEGLMALAARRTGHADFELELVADERVIAFAGAITLGTALVLGLVPVWHARSSDLQQAMGATAPSVTAGGARHRVAGALVAAQVGLSLVLLTAAGLLASSLSKLHEVPTGFDLEHVLQAGIDVQRVGVDEDRARVLYEDIPRRLAAEPGIVAASLSTPWVFGGGLGWTVSYPGTDRPMDNFPFYRVTPGYFDTLGLKIVRGRGFDHADNRDAPRVALVSQTMAEKEFGGSDAVGQLIRLDSVHDVEVVGVVSDARTRDVRQPLESMFYLPVAQPHGIPANLPPSGLLVRGHGDPALLTERVRRSVAEAHPGLAIMSVRPLSDQLDRMLVKDHLLALLAFGFGLSALLLVAIGLYGVISQWAAQRTREMGIRMALGATPRGVQWLVLRQALSLLLIGLGFGTVGALAVSRLLEGLLFQVEPLDWGVLVGASLALGAVAAFAAYLPARRASRVDPMHALRSE
jgi:predicted permease